MKTLLFTELTNWYYYLLGFLLSYAVYHGIKTDDYVQTSIILFVFFCIEVRHCSRRGSR